MCVCSVVSNALQSLGLLPARLLLILAWDEVFPWLGFSRQEYWSGLLFPTPVNLPNPGMELATLASLALTGEFFYHCASQEALYLNKYSQKLQGHNYYLLKFTFWTSTSQKITMLKMSELRLESIDSQINIIFFIPSHYLK